ncbi:hypothetical protein STEG23_004124, partial [Scotinomys teguina]
MLVVTLTKQNLVLIASVEKVLLNLGVVNGEAVGCHVAENKAGVKRGPTRDADSLKMVLGIGTWMCI